MITNASTLLQSNVLSIRKEFAVNKSRYANARMLFARDDIFYKSFDRLNAKHKDMVFSIMKEMYTQMTKYSLHDFSIQKISDDMEKMSKGIFKQLIK